MACEVVNHGRPSADLAILNEGRCPCIGRVVIQEKEFSCKSETNTKSDEIKIQKICYSIKLVKSLALLGSLIEDFLVVEKPIGAIRKIFRLRGKPNW